MANDCWGPAPRPVEGVLHQNGDVRSFTHPGGRFCTRGADGAWTYDNGRYHCPLVHHLGFEAKDVEKDAPGVNAALSERGEFGMPGLGVEVDVTSHMQAKAAEFNAPKATWRVSDAGITIDYGEQGMFVAAVTDDAGFILVEVLPTLLKRFLESNAKYAKAQKHDLGAKGIIPDINRKTAVLIDRLWDGAAVVGEPTDEVIDDLIGHLLLMRAKMR